MILNPSGFTLYSATRPCRSPTRVPSLQENRHGGEFPTASLTQTHKQHEDYASVFTGCRRNALDCVHLCALVWNFNIKPESHGSIKRHLTAHKHTHTHTWNENEKKMDRTLLQSVLTASWLNESLISFFPNTHTQQLVKHLHCKSNEPSELLIVVPRCTVWIHSHDLDVVHEREAREGSTPSSYD